MFKSQFYHTLDDKGRLVLPTKFRTEIANGAVLTIGFDGCLTIYTAQEWDRFFNSLLSKSMTSAPVRKVARTLAGNAIDIEIDKSGRVNIPKYLLEIAEIDKEVTIVGRASVIEIWSTKKWQKENAANITEFAAHAENIDLSGLE